MTDAQARNERIAQFLEPCETLPEIVWSSTVGMHVPSRANVRPGEKSPKGWWSIGPGMKWRARDFDTDESASFMMLKAMPYPKLECDGMAGKAGWSCYYDDSEQDHNDGVFHEDPQIAIRLAFERWAGLEEK